MQCTRCGARDTRVIDSREAVNAVRRRRQCPECGHRFTTYERVETAKPLVVKRDGTREPWNRAKLQEGIRLACNKRPVPSSVIEELVDDVESRLTSTGRTEVTATEIGQAVMRQLRFIDEVAYIRFASVYLRFRDASGFIEEAENVRRRQHISDSQLALDI